ncbi:MAG: protoporphyrinogen oxidase [Actinomycetes bacterium]|nr:protoporphyrinogen oxidase [Actinomycetes bacterium]
MSAAPSGSSASNAVNVPHIVIIGGGATGLGAAVRLRRAQLAGAQLSFELLERDTRLGGKVAGAVVDDPEHGRFVFDGGPDCISAHNPAGRAMSAFLGLDEHWLPSNEPAKRVWIYRDGRPHLLPSEFSMFVPTGWDWLQTSDILSEAGKAEMLREPDVPPKPLPAGRNDETLESFVTRRFGRETLDYLAEPFIGGVHASDPAQMSLAATFPMYLDMEQKYGSIIKGTIAARRAREAAAAGKPRDPRNTVFATFDGGLHQLTDAMADYAGREHLHTGCSVTAIRRDGERYVICCNTVDHEKTSDEVLGPERADHEKTSDEVFSESARHVAVNKGAAQEKTSDEVFSESAPLASNTAYRNRMIVADAVIIATESFAASPLTASIAPDISAAYAAIPNLTSATASFVFRAADLPRDRYDGFGVLVPEVEKRNLLAVTFSSTKWPGRTPPGYVMLRGFAGTPQNQQVMEHDDATLTAIILDELRQVLALPGEITPVLSRMWRWVGGMSQYTMGHLDRVEAIEAAVARTPGLACAGGCFRGVGVPNCIDGGTRAAVKVMGDLRIGDPLITDTED